jgi:hypothetical protein
MLWIGCSSSGKGSWLAWVLTDIMDEDNRKVGTGKEDMTISEKHYWMAVMFLAEMLRWIGHQDIIVTTQYQSLEDDLEYMHATNLM